MEALRKIEDRFGIYTATGAEIYSVQAGKQLWTKVHCFKTLFGFAETDEGFNHWNTIMSEMDRMEY